mmetsp:Transcript_19497/g.42651  ORF Transcript_19497/g.42651 Transcript_19497/m.42651 type:complete len:207 (+) Transcript_19497:2338-2958(+)
MHSPPASGNCYSPASASSVRDRGTSAGGDGGILPSGCSGPADLCASSSHKRWQRLRSAEPSATAGSLRDSAGPLPGVVATSPGCRLERKLSREPVALPEASAVGFGQIGLPGAAALPGQSSWLLLWQPESVPEASSLRIDEWLLPGPGSRGGLSAQNSCSSSGYVQARRHGAIAAFSCAALSAGDAEAQFSSANTLPSVACESLAS